MARRMIPVRHRVTGQTATVSETAYPLFAAHYERLDQPEQPPAPAPKAAAGDTARPTTPPASARPAAPKTTKE